MPMVDTSVAVATPSITAARITNGRAIAGKAITKARPISPALGAPHVGQVLAPVAPPHHQRRACAEHDARQHARR